MTTLDFGVLIHSTPRGGAIPEMRATNERLLAAAVEHGLSAWIVDHFQLDRQPILECFALLAHTAGRYPELELGTLVLGQSYRNPALTAKIASSLQFLMRRPLILGIGAGWKEDEYRAYGYPYPPARVRLAQLDEAVRILKALWQEGPANFAGEHYQIANAYNEPRTTPAPILMIGGGGEQRTLRITAEHADWWNVDYCSAEAYARKLGLLRTYCDELGRDPAAIRPTYYAGVSISHNPDRLVRRLPVHYKPDMVVLNGSPDEVTAQLAAYAAAGAVEVQLNFLDFPRTEGLELFLSEVLPRFTPTGRRQPQAAL